MSTLAVELDAANVSPQLPLCSMLLLQVRACRYITLPLHEVKASVTCSVQGRLFHLDDYFGRFLSFYLANILVCHRKEWEPPPRDTVSFSGTYTSTPAGEQEEEQPHLTGWIKDLFRPNHSWWVFNNVKINQVCFGQLCFVLSSLN